MNFEALDKIIKNQIAKTLSQNQKSSDWLEYAERVNDAWFINQEKPTGDQIKLLEKIVNDVYQKLGPEVIKSIIAERVSVMVNS